MPSPMIGMAATFVALPYRSNATRQLLPVKLST
jgi:hypothetical protein